MDSINYSLSNDEKLLLTEEKFKNNNYNKNNININNINIQEEIINSNMIPSITSSPLQQKKYNRVKFNIPEDNSNSNNNNSINNGEPEIIQQQQQQQQQYNHNEGNQEHKNPNTLEKIWGLFFSLDKNNNQNEDGSISPINNVDENQIYINNNNNSNNNEGSPLSSEISSSSSLVSTSSKNNIILNNSDNNIFLDNNNVKLNENIIDNYNDEFGNNYDEIEIREKENNREEEEEEEEPIENNRIWDLFFSLSINRPDKKEQKDKEHLQQNNSGYSNNIKYSNLILEDKNNKKEIIGQQQSVENVYKQEQEQQSPIIEISSEKQQQEEQINDEQNNESKKPLETTSAEVVKSIFEKSPFFEPSRPVIDYSDPVFLEPIESKLPGNLEKNKHLYENIKPNPIPLSTILTGITVKDLQGNEVLVTSLYEKKRIVVAIFRRFGCLICRLQALDLSSLKPKLDKMGIELIGIGFDEEGIDEFLQYNFFAGKIYLDKNRQVYRALNLKRRSKLTTYELFLDPRVMTYYRRMKELGLPSNYRKDGFQLGATLVLGPRPQETLYDFRPQRYADIFDLKEIWAACQTPYPEESEIGNIKKLDLTIPKPITIKCDPVHFNLIKQDSQEQPLPIKELSSSSTNDQQPEVNYRNNNLVNISFKLSDNVYVNTKKESNRNRYYEDEEDEEEYEEYEEDEEYDDEEDDGYYDDSADDDEEMEDEEDVMQGVKLPKPSEDSIKLLQLINTISVDQSLYQSNIDTIPIFTPPSLDLTDQQQEQQQQQQNQPSPMVSTSQEQEYIDKINNTEYINFNNYSSFYKPSKSSTFIMRDKDEEENQLIYCPYKFQG